MSLTEPERQALGSLADGLAGSDPRLASMLNIFSRLAAGEEMPAREKIRGAARAAGRPPFAPRPAAPALGSAAAGVDGAVGSPYDVAVVEDDRWWLAARRASDARVQGSSPASVSRMLSASGRPMRAIGPHGLGG